MSLFHLNKCINLLQKCSLQLNTNVHSATPIRNLFQKQIAHQSSIHTTSRCYDLMQFFDDPKNWGQNEVKVGRAWTKDELRIKSNKDLHQIWYVLLKEKNMLLTMENECKDKMELFPSAERIDKVEISMENLETVVRERNKAYHLLETGVDGEQKKYIKENQLGINFKYAETEHLIPQEINSKWQQKYNRRPVGFAVQKFLLKYREKLYNEKRKRNNRNRNEVMHLLKRNPNLDKTLLAEKFPNVDIAKMIRENKTRGHYVPE